MGKSYLIDSNVIIDFFSGSFDKTGLLFLEDIFNQTPVVSIITKLEVLGFNAPFEEYRLLKQFFDDALVLNLNEKIVSQTIELRKNKRIKLPDAIIAATALVHNHTLLTRNTIDFFKVANIEIMNPHNL